MFTVSHADVYEIVYRSRGKNWEEEAKDLAERIREIKPDANSLLDVACGTGAHLVGFAEQFDRIEGLEISEPMLEVTRKRLPDIPLHVQDMRDFDLGTTYDAIVNMYGSIGYVDGVEELRAAIRCMAAHLNPGGVLLLEPWWFPEKFIDGYVAGYVAEDEGRVITRISHSTRVGDKTRMELRFVVGDSSGLTEFTEIDLISLWTEEEYLSAFADAGCPATYTPGWPTGTGLFVGVRAG